MDLQSITWDGDTFSNIIEYRARPLKAYAQILEDEVNKHFYDPENKGETNTLFTIIYDVERVAEGLEETLERLGREIGDAKTPKNLTKQTIA